MALYRTPRLGSLSGSEVVSGRRVTEWRMLPGVGRKGSVVLNLLGPNGEYKHNFGSSHCFLFFFPFLGEGRIYLQQDAKTSVCLPTVGSVGSTGGTIRCTNT